MKVSFRAIATAAAISLALTSTSALAGEAVYGYGNTRQEAAADANRSAAIMSQSKFGRSDCRTPVNPSKCYQDAGGWVCIAYLANHKGSCGF